MQEGRERRSMACTFRLKATQISDMNQCWYERWNCWVVLLFHDLHGRSINFNITPNYRKASPLNCHIPVLRQIQTLTRSKRCQRYSDSPRSVDPQDRKSVV